jgi:DNA invertase Pin-like site-specific DNA recombinase
MRAQGITVAEAARNGRRTAESRTDVPRTPVSSPGEHGVARRVEPEPSSQRTNTNGGTHVRHTQFQDQEGPGVGGRLMRVVGYTRVSTTEQADSGAGLAAQEEAIVRECGARGYHLMSIHQDAGWSAATMERPAIRIALAALDNREADALMVAKLDRLSRSLFDFSSLMERARKKGWGLIALDLGVDTSTPAGEMMASVLATFAQFERRLIGQRTKDALNVKRAAGVKLGRPRMVAPVIAERIARERADGRTLTAIADDLTAESIPTAQGGLRWYASTVRSVLTYTQSR